MNSEADAAKPARRDAADHRPPLARRRRAGDAGDLSVPYPRGVEQGLDDGEFETPDTEDLKRRRKKMQKRKMPHIVAEENGVVLGYAYAVPFRKRPAYRYAVKHSIYVHTDHLQSRRRAAPDGRR